MLAPQAPTENALLKGAGRRGGVRAGLWAGRRRAPRVRQACHADRKNARPLAASAAAGSARTAFSAFLNASRRPREAQKSRRMHPNEGPGSHGFFRNLERTNDPETLNGPQALRDLCGL
jgi:hypothetical protein